MTESSGRRLFKIGAGLLILTGLVHSVSLFLTPVPLDETHKQLLDLMNTYRMQLPGAMRTMSELMRGFSISFMLGILAIGALDFAVANERPATLRRVALLNAIWLGPMLAVSLRFFFLIPTSFLALCFVPFALAFVALPKSSTPPA